MNCKQQTDIPNIKIYSNHELTFNFYLFALSQQSNLLQRNEIKMHFDTYNTVLR